MSRNTIQDKLKTAVNELLALEWLTRSSTRCFVVDVSKSVAAVPGWCSRCYCHQSIEIRTPRMMHLQLVLKAGIYRFSTYKNAKNESRTFLVEYEKYCSPELIPRASNVSGETATTSNLCPCISDTLVGRMNTSLRAPQFGQLELLHTELSCGGSWTPLDRWCVPRHHSVTWSSATSPHAARRSSRYSSWNRSSRSCSTGPRW